MTQPLSLAVLDASKPVAVLDRASLAQAVAIAALAVERKNTIPILSNLRLVGDGESLTVTGTDLDIEIKARVAGAADSRLAVTVPAHMLKDILAKAKASELASIDDATDAGGIRAGIDMGGVRFNLQALPVEDFPDLVGPDIADTFRTKTFTISPNCLSQMFDKVQFAISCEETRYYLNGVYLHHGRRTAGEAGYLRAVATDGHRLAMMETEAPDGCQNMPGVIVPTKTIKTVLTVLKAMAKACKPAFLPQVAVAVSPSKLRFTIGGTVEITTKLIDGTYPDYERVIPRHNDKPATIGVKALGEAISQVAIICSERAAKVKLAFTAGNCRLTVADAENGSSETDVPCDYASEEIEIGLNARYVTDILAEINGADAVWSFADSGSPVVVTDPANAMFSAVLMPCRV